MAFAVGLGISPVFGTRGAPAPPSAFIPTANQVLHIGPFAAFGESVGSVAALSAWSPTRGTFNAQGGGVYRFSEDSSTGTHLVAGVPANTADGAVRVAFDVRKVSGGRQWCTCELDAGGGQSVDITSRILGASYAIGGGSVVGATITALSDGWDHCAVDFTTTAAPGAWTLYSETAAGAPGGYTGDGRDNFDVRNVVLTQRRHSAYPCQFGLHDAAQADPLKQPLYGPNGRGESRAGRFNGSSNHMDIAAGGGWPAATYKGHSIFALVNRRSAAAWGFLMDILLGRLSIFLGANVADTLGWYDTTNRAISDAVLGKQLLEWHLDADAGTGTLIRTTHAGATVLGSAVYVGTALGGTTTLMRRYTDAYYAQADLGELTWASYESGTMPEAHRQQMRTYLLDHAAKNDWSLVA